MGAEVIQPELAVVGAAGRRDPLVLDAGRTRGGRRQVGLPADAIVGDRGQRPQRDPDLMSDAKYRARVEPAAQEDRRAAPPQRRECRARRLEGRLHGLAEIAMGLELRPGPGRGLDLPSVGSAAQEGDLQEPPDLAERGQVPERLAQRQDRRPPAPIHVHRHAQPPHQAVDPRGEVCGARVVGPVQGKRPRHARVDRASSRSDHEPAGVEGNGRVLPGSHRGRIRRGVKLAPGKPAGQAGPPAQRLTVEPQGGAAVGVDLARARRQRRGDALQDRAVVAAERTADDRVACRLLHPGGILGAGQISWPRHDPDLRLLPADPARGSGRRGVGLAPPARPGGARAPARRRALDLAARRPPRPYEGRGDPPRGDERDGRARAADARVAARRALAAHRPLRHRRALQARRPQGRPARAGDDSRGEPDLPRRARGALLPRPAVAALPHPDQGAGRAAPPRRRAPHPRVPDEGRILVRPRRRGPRRELRAVSQGLRPHLRPLRPRLVRSRRRTSG